MPHMTDTTHAILASTKRFFSGTLLSRFSGLARDVAMAYAFGTSAAVAAFLVAFRFAHLLRRLFGEGAMQAAFVPQFESLRHEDPLRAAFFFRDLRRVVVYILIGIITTAGIGLALLYTAQVIPPDTNQIVGLTALMLPSLLFICLFGLNASVLQCEKHYFLPAISPIAFNTVWVIAALCLVGIPEQQAMFWLAGGIIIATLAQWLFTQPQTSRILAACTRQPITWSMPNPFGSDVARMGKPLLFGMVGVAAAQINNFMDAIFARYAALEGPAYLWYAVRIEQLPIGLFGVALSGALLPPLARAFKAGDQKKYLEFLFYCLEKAVMLLLPLSFVLWLMGSSGISVVYARGDFGVASIAGTTSCLWMYAIGLLPMGLVQVLAPAFYARQNYDIPMRASLVAMATNLSLNTLFAVVLGWDTPSVALATSISAWINVLILGGCLWAREPKAPWRCWLRNSSLVLLLSLVSAAVLIYGSPYSLTSVLEQAIHLAGLSWAGKGRTLLLQGLLFGGAYLAGFIILTRLKALRANMS